MKRELIILGALIMASGCETAPEPSTEAQPVEASDDAAPAEPVALTPGPATDTLPASETFTPDASLQVCPRMNVHNAPAADSDGFIISYSPFIRVDGVVLSVAPTPGVCLSSSFGQRNSSFHKGLDFRTAHPGEVYAAGAGTIREAGYRDDYGFNVILDHGNGVFTRYAHLVRLEDGIEVGNQIPFGQPLGPMGNSSKFTLPVHLHYEILTGDYDTPKKSFGLTPVDPFTADYVTAD